MRKAVFITLFIFLFYLIEFFLFNMVGRWFMPNLLLLLVIYFNLVFGIRYSIFAAVLAGVLKDSFGVGIFGLNVFSFVMYAYVTTFLKRYLHYVASRSSRLLLVFIVTTAYVTIYFFLQTMLGRADVFIPVIKYIFIPEVLTTLIVTSFVFTQLRKCVLKLFV